MNVETRNSDLDSPTLGTANSPTAESPEESSPSSNDEDEYFYRIQNNQTQLNPNKRRKIGKSLWFLGIEENFVISQIFQIFEQSLHHLLIKNHSRDPNLFIGQIIRKVVENENENDKPTFRTIDKILIFENKNLKWGEPYLPKRMVVTASTWSDSEGLPVQISEIQNSVASVASTPLSVSSGDENFFSRNAQEKDDNAIETKDENLNLEDVEKQWSKIKTSYVLQKLPDFSEIDESTTGGERNLMRKMVHLHRTEDDDEDLELQQPHKRAMLERTFSLRSYKTQEEKDLFTHIPFSDPLNDIITKTFFCSEKGQHFIQKQNEYLKKLMESDSQKFSKDDGNAEQDQEPQELEEEKEDEDDPFDFENFNISIQITRIQGSTQQPHACSTHSEEKGLLEDTCEYLADLLYGSKDPNEIFFQEQGIAVNDFGDFGEEEGEEEEEEEEEDEGEEHPENKQPDEDDVEEEQEDAESEEEEESDEEESEEEDEQSESEEDDDSDEKEEEEYTDYQQLINNMQTQIQLVC